MAAEITAQNKFFTADRISPRTIRIMGMGGELCYLVEGTERALLIDGLSGVGSIRAFVRELTELPVMAAVTHGHIDHTGAVWEYGECYIHPDDIALMYSPAHSDSQARLNFATMDSFLAPERRCIATLDDVVPACPVKTYPIYNGDIFDLGGGVNLEVIAVPGHTYGTVVFLDRDERTVYSGDACNMSTLLCLEGSTSIEEYEAGLLRLKEYEGAFDRMYGGHGPMAVPASIVDDAIAMCRRIMEGKDDAIETSNPLSARKTYFMGSKMNEDYLPVCGGYANIMYTKEAIFWKERPVIKGNPIIYK